MDVQVASGDGERGARGAVWTWTEVQGEADAEERETCSAPLQSGQVGDGEGPPESPGYRLRSSCLSPAPRPCRLVEVTGGPDAAPPSPSPPFLDPSATERGDETPAFSPLSKSACLHLGDFGAVRDICS